MSASTGPREAGRKPGDIVVYPVGPNTNINKGALVVTRGDGFAYPARLGAGASADLFLGIAYETVNNNPGSSGALTVRCYKRGAYQFALPSAVQANIGAKMYAADDQTLTTANVNGSNPNTLVGTAAALIDNGDVELWIENAVS